MKLAVFFHEDDRFGRAAAHAAEQLAAELRIELHTQAQADGVLPVGVRATDLSTPIHVRYWMMDFLDRHGVSSAIAFIRGHDDPLRAAVAAMARQMHWPCVWVCPVPKPEQRADLAGKILMDWFDSVVIFVPETEISAEAVARQCLEAAGRERQCWQMARLD